MILKKAFAPAALFLILSCVSVSYVKTGQEYPPLAPGAEVKVLDGKASPGGYKEIGIITAKGGSDQKRLNKAIEETRKHGGDAIIPREPKTVSGKKADGTQGSGPMDKMDAQSTTVIQEFVAAKIVEQKKETKADLPGGAEDYRNLPRAGYNTLLDDYESYRDQKFRGALYPVNFFKVPAKLAKHAGEDRHLLMMSTSKGKSKVLLFVPKTMEGDIREMIESREQLKFVYSPVDVYRTKKGERYPVLVFIDKIQE